MSKKAIVLINQLSENPTHDEADVLDQACEVEDALAALDYETTANSWD